MHRTVRRPAKTQAIPAAVRHLFRKKILDETLDPLIRAPKMRRAGLHHAGNARLAVFELRREIDAAVRVKTVIEQCHATAQGLRMQGRQAQLPDQLHRVGCASPFRLVRAASPVAIGVLPGQQSRTPAGRRDLPAFALDDAVAGATQIAQRLSADGGIAVEQPFNDWVTRGHRRSSLPIDLPRLE